eukprot:UN02198
MVQLPPIFVFATIFISFSLLFTIKNLFRSKIPHTYSRFIHCHGHYILRHLLRFCVIVYVI